MCAYHHHHRYVIFYPLFYISMTIIIFFLTKKTEVIMLFIIMITDTWYLFSSSEKMLSVKWKKWSRMWRHCTATGGQRFKLTRIKWKIVQLWWIWWGWWWLSSFSWMLIRFKRRVAFWIPHLLFRPSSTSSLSTTWTSPPSPPPRLSVSK